MRGIQVLPLVATILLAACGGNSADADGDGAVSGEEAAAAVEDAVRPEPGQYRTTSELLEFDMPGMSESIKEQMRSAMGGQFAQATTFCLTPEDAAANGARKMVENMARSDCTFSQFDVSGGMFSADMQCAGDGGANTRMVIEGEMSATRSDTTMTMDAQAAGMGQMHMKVRGTTERIGDCA